MVFSNFSDGLSITIGSLVYDIILFFDAAKIRKI